MRNYVEAAAVWFFFYRRMITPWTQKSKEDFLKEVMAYLKKDFCTVGGNMCILCMLELTLSCILECRSIT